MRRIVWMLIPLALGAPPALAAPTASGLPEMLFPAPAFRHRSSAQVTPQRPPSRRDLGDYNVPGDRAGQPSEASPARA